MVFQGVSESALDMSLTNSKKLTPGPYRATKMWNDIVKNFREKMLCKKHRRHLRTYNDCFTASESVDFLHELLKTNCNIGKDVTRQQTIQLLRKFLRNHVIEDVQGRWGSENFEDDGKLFRFPPNISIAQALRYPLGNLDVNVSKPIKKLPIKKQKRKSKEPTKKEMENNNFSSEKNKNETETFPRIKSQTSASTPSFEHLKRPLPPVPVIPKCRVFSQPITDSSVQNIWKNVLLGKLQESLELDTLEDILAENEVKGEHIQHNATKVGRSGVVQVEKEEDLPYWALSAMTCLANWPHGKDTGLPCYPGFEKDVFKAVCDYYCELQGSNNDTKSQKRTGTPEIQPQPLLTYEFYELFTNILCLLQPDSENQAVESLRYALLLLPPVNRRKLHLLLRLMSKMCNNGHLDKLGAHLSTRTLLLQKFSTYILSCNEEVYLDELIAMRLVTFLIDHHLEIMKVPSDIENSVQEKIASMRRPSIHYDEAGEEGPFTQYTFAPPSGVRSRIRNKNQHGDRNKRKSTDLMRSWDKLVTTIRNKPANYNSSSGTDTSDSESYVHVRSYTKHEDSSRSEVQQQLLRNREHHFRQRTHTIASRVFGFRSGSPQSSTKPNSDGSVDLNESRMKPAKSCSDIFDMKISPSSNKIQTKSELGSSSWNLRLRPSAVFGRPFSKLRRSKV